MYLLESMFGYIMMVFAMKSFFPGGREFYFRRIWILQLSCMGVGTRCLSCWSWYSTHINTGHRRVSLVSMVACVFSIGFPPSWEVWAWSLCLTPYICGVSGCPSLVVIIYVFQFCDSFSIRVLLSFTSTPLVLASCMFYCWRSIVQDPSVFTCCALWCQDLGFTLRKWQWYLSSYA